eukprot:g28765.t1
MELWFERFRGAKELSAVCFTPRQVFHNLLYVRYPHSSEKQRNPDRFWIPENQKVSRQKEAAMQQRRIKPKG